MSSMVRLWSIKPSVLKLHPNSRQNYTEMIESWLLSGELKGLEMELVYKNQEQLRKKVLNFIKSLAKDEREFFLTMLKTKEQIRILKMLVEDRERA